MVCWVGSCGWLGGCVGRGGVLLGVVFYWFNCVVIDWMDGE